MHYKLTENEYITEIAADCSAYKHKSGATIITLKNEDSNRVFSITFRTLPKDDTGAAHILEHSVLCGSKKYDLRDPFNELSKGTIHTYLNAMTFFDKTMYPIASTNESEFKKLMDVYLDAVFFSLLYERKEIFLQEGHHMNGDEITGVVYNEMKGVFSSPERILDYELKKRMYPDVGYKYYSGGVPEAIKTLTYEQLLEFHKTYYHPSNSIIYLYGDIDMEHYMEYIHDNYLSGFEDTGIMIDYKTQEPFGMPAEAVKTYAIREGTSRDNYLAAGYVADNELSAQLEILTDILLGTPASPLKKALQDSKIALNINGYFDMNLFQPRICIMAEKSGDEDTERFKAVINDTLKRLVKEGIDSDLKTACINSYEFCLREDDYGRRPKGLTYNIKLMRTFLYGKYSFEPLKKLRTLPQIRDTDFEQLIEKYMLNNNHSVYLVLKGEAEKEEVKNPAHSQTADIHDLPEDTEESLKKIRLLNIDEIKKDIEHIDMTEESVDETSLYLLEEKTNGIMYISFMFDTGKAAKINYIGLLNYLLGEINTVNFGQEKLSNEINTYLGELSIHFKSCSSILDESYLPFICINTKCFTRNADKAFSIVNEIITSTLFDDKKRLNQLILELKTKLEKNFLKNGHQAAMLRCGSYYNSACSYSDDVGGIAFYGFIKNLADNFEAKYDEIISSLEEMKQQVFTKENLEISLTADSVGTTVIELQADFVNKLSGKRHQKQPYFFSKEQKNEGIIMNSQVHYNVMSGSCKDSGFKYNGGIVVLNKILTSDYMWNRLRTVGGAYGGGAKLNEDGTVYFYSYRDPNILKTYDAYKAVHKYAGELDLTGRELKKYIIGTISQTDRPLKPYEKASLWLSRKKTGVTEEFLLKQREDILKVSAQDLKKFGELLRTVTEQNYICTLGGGKDILNNSGLFGRVIYL